MFCGECGAPNPDTNQFCRNCGRPLKKHQQVPAMQPAAVPGQPVQAQPAQPVVSPAPVAGMQQPGPGAGGPIPPAPRSIGMLILGILSLLAGVAAFVFYPYVLGAAAVILGGISVYGTRKKTGKIAFIAVIGIIAGLAAILTDNFYFILFPPKELTFDLLAALA